MTNQDPGPVPDRWLHCPRKSSGLIAEKFLAFKTPLGPKFNDKLPECNRFTPSMLFSYVKDLKLKLGLWIDLTNTSRFYDKKEIEKMDCKYVKLSCRGHGETPSVEQTRAFIKIVKNFIAQNPLLIIGVHCTHGFNRTGFLLVSYMTEELDCSVDAALAVFAHKRDPGIYKQDYILELYKRYDDETQTPTAPPRPDWCDEEEIDYDDDDAPSFSQSSHHATAHKNAKNKKRKKETNYKKASFMPEVHGVEPFDSQPRLLQVQQKVQQFCKWESTGFPGSQPVSMDMDNIKKLHKKPYRVSWKADGVRYMMLIEDKDEVYMLDRDNCAFKVHGLYFPHNKEDRHLRNTLLDGEMVVDHVDGESKPRFLCYDIIRFEDQNVGKEPFHPVRSSCIQNEIISPRDRAITSGAIDKTAEPFRVALKAFWDVAVAERLLGEQFARSLHHEPDGLIFQPAKEPYVPGQCDDVLKWKPSDMNSVDFRLKIVSTECGIKKVTEGYLYVGSLTRPFAVMKNVKNIKHLHDKIIECKYEDNKWVFMRERTDKSFPNSFKTAMSVSKSIQNPVTKEYLLHYIARYRYQVDSEHMPPPKRRR
ncbi:mRNA-capping enzyme [Colias croceus]|uniref:mRNA-capping enzyme n=1 Tax=Colias crocea TaxID=72248 RepID=UPI001E27FBD4|nr:mRNA-capping enzyme [Colias croceus]